jgi:hypothetical protein
MSVIQQKNYLQWKGTWKHEENQPIETDPGTTTAVYNTVVKTVSINLKGRKTEHVK